MVDKVLVLIFWLSYEQRVTQKTCEGRFSELQKIQMGMMSSINACFIMLVLSSVGAIAKTKVFNDSAGPEEEAYSYNGPIDFYYFVQQWPASYCHSRGGCCGKQPTSYFSVHGLWPTYKKGHWPSDCCSSGKLEFDRKHHCSSRKFKIPSSDLSHMNRYWKSFSCKRNEQFWKHEWDKHGTCSTLSARSYFESTLSLRRQIHLLRALEEAGIYPNGRDYKLTNIEDAITHGLRVRPRVKCNRNREGKSQLFEVYVCVKLDASTLMDCPTSTGNCDPMVVFPRFGG